MCAQVSKLLILKRPRGYIFASWILMPFPAPHRCVIKFSPHSYRSFVSYRADVLYIRRTCIHCVYSLLVGRASRAFPPWIFLAQRVPRSDECVSPSQRTMRHALAGCSIRFARTRNHRIRGHNSRYERVPWQRIRTRHCTASAVWAGMYICT